MPQRVLNVAEKNDAAKELAKIMSHGRFQRVSYYTRTYGSLEILIAHVARRPFEVQQDLRVYA